MKTTLTTILFFVLWAPFAMSSASLNDSIDPNIPEDVLNLTSCEGTQLTIPYLEAPEEGEFFMEMWDFDGLLSDDISGTISIVNDAQNFQNDFTVGPGILYQSTTFACQGGDQITVTAIHGGENDSIAIYTCGELLYTGLIGPDFFFTAPASCFYSEFPGTWEVCGGPGGEFVDSTEFTTVFHADSLGWHTLCFHSDWSDSTYVINALVQETGCADPNACNYIEFACDNGACVDVCSDCHNYILEPTYFTSLWSNDYIETLDVTQGQEGAAINQTSDLSSLWVALEHSRMGDVEISIMCPNGQELLIQPALGGAFSQELGEPINDNTEDVGVCYTYYFTEASANGYWENVVDSPIPEGGYASVGDWEELLGCPINGEWTIQVADEAPFAEGTVCGWGLYFDPSVLNDDCQDAPISGCLDSAADNYNPFATVDDGGCTFPGCTDELACNYDPSAGTDNGSCVYLGCTTYDISTDVQSFCGYTQVWFWLDEITPSWAEVNVTVPSENIEVSLDQNPTVVTVFGPGNVELFLSTNLNGDPENTEEINWGEVEVFQAQEQPVIALDNNMLVCLNCDNITSYSWYQNDVLIANSNAIDLSFGSGEYLLCTDAYVPNEQPSCEVCSESLIYTRVHEHEEWSVAVLNNGSAQPLIHWPNSNTVATLFDLSGREIFQQEVIPNSSFYIPKIPSGVYQLRIGNQTVSVSIIR